MKLLTITLLTLMMCVPVLADISAKDSSGVSLGRSRSLKCGADFACTDDSGDLLLSLSATVTMAAVSISGVLTASGDIVGDGGDQLYGFLENQIASTTASLTIAECGSTIVSDSADVIVLPEASTALGCRYTFVCGTADDFDINPADGTDVIGIAGSITGANTTTVLAPAAGDAIRCTDIGASIILEAVQANLWVSIGSSNGIWTDVN